VILLVWQLDSDLEWQPSDLFSSEWVFLFFSEQQDSSFFSIAQQSAYTEGFRAPKSIRIAKMKCFIGIMN
jgi:hypothetical protein